MTPAEPVGNPVDNPSSTHLAHLAPTSPMTAPKMGDLTTSPIPPLPYGGWARSVGVEMGPVTSPIGGPGSHGEQAEQELAEMRAIQADPHAPIPRERPTT